VVAPSVWLETFGLVVVEAMAVGVPVIAAAHGAFVELVEDGITGLLHRPGDVATLADQLAEVVRDPERNVRVGEAARARYDRDFHPSVGVERLVANYRAAIAGRACPPL
jgi:glycosyltransferase involved in cell wall biosynthesis